MLNSWFMKFKIHFCPCSLFWIIKASYDKIYPSICLFICPFISLDVCICYCMSDCLAYLSFSVTVFFFSLICWILGGIYDNMIYQCMNMLCTYFFSRPSVIIGWPREIELTQHGYILKTLETNLQFKISKTQPSL